jgi:hypothetical protein
MPADVVLIARWLCPRGLVRCDQQRAALGKIIARR